MSKILDGKKLSQELASGLAKKIKSLKTKPKLVIIQVGDIAESNIYIRRKVLFGEKVGAIVEHKLLKNDTSEKKLISIISKLNTEKSTHGIIVQLPLPEHLNPESVLDAISETKRVDGGKHFLPATTRGILTLLERHKIKVSGKKVVVVGRSNLVGKPTALALLNLDATVTVCHKKTKDLRAKTKQADILIVATGNPKLISKSHVSPNQVVIDVGINITRGKKLVGDVDFENVKGVVKAISPVPGGVGPMTVASLFENLLDGYSLQT